MRVIYKNTALFDQKTKERLEVEFFFSLDHKENKRL